jgi:hypothetical protein
MITVRSAGPRSGPETAGCSLRRIATRGLSAFALLVAMGSHSAAQPPAATGRPNIVLIYADDKVNHCAEEGLSNRKGSIVGLSVGFHHRTNSGEFSATPWN